MVVDNPTIQAIQRSLANRSPRRATDPRASEAAVALILVPSGNDAELLFIKRAERRGDPWSGQMALPGGRRGPLDEGLRDTAVRETEEETAVHLTRRSIVGELDDLHPVTPTLPPVIVRPFVFAVAPRPSVLGNHEVASHVWISLATLRKRAAKAHVEVHGSCRMVDAYVVGPHVIWGMTHRIIKPFLGLVNLPF